MGTFIIGQRTKERRSKKDGWDEVDVFIFGHKPTMYSTLEDAAGECEKIVKKNILSTWCVFELVSETKTEDYPVKTFLVSDREVSASSAEP